MLKYGDIELQRMTHATPTSNKIKSLKAEARQAEKDLKAARQLGAVDILEDLESRHSEALAAAAILEASGQARLEDLSVWQMEKVKGGRSYLYWMATWRQNKKLHHEHLGSCIRMSQVEALQKARVIKAKALAIKS
jgi:hypothetical protein